DTLSAPGASSAGLLSSDPEGAKALSELPGESWLAVGLGHLGASLPQDVEGLRALSALSAAPGPTSPEGTSTSTLSIKSLLAAMIAPLTVLGAPSAHARHDFASWMGSAGALVGGPSLLELKDASA